MTLALVACIIATTAIADDNQRWSVQIEDDIAVIRVSKNTEHKFVTATITSLQNAGTEKVALHVLDPDADTNIAKNAFSIQINDGVAEIRATADLRHTVLVSLIRQLKDAGIAKMKLAVQEGSDGVPAPPR